jgi:hypothetical protein
LIDIICLLSFSFRLDKKDVWKYSNSQEPVHKQKCSYRQRDRAIYSSAYETYNKGKGKIGPDFLIHIERSNVLDLDKLFRISHLSHRPVIKRGSAPKTADFPRAVRK